MPFLNDEAYDKGLDWVVANGTKFHITTAEAATYAEANVTLSLGSKAVVALTGPTNGDVSGRKATIPAITDGVVDSAGDATHYALTDGSSILVSAGPLASLIAVSDPGPFTTAAIDITFSDVVGA